MPTLPDNPGISRIQSESPGLPYGSDKSEFEHHCKLTSCLQMYPKGPCKRSQQHATVGANNVISCCAMCANARDKSPHVGSFYIRIQGPWETNTHNSIHTTLWCACAGATLLNVLCKRTQYCWNTLRWPRNNRNVGTCWLWSLTSFKLHPTTSNKSQQHATTHNMVCKRSQHVGPNNVASCWPTMLRAFARALNKTISVF